MPADLTPAVIGIDHVQVTIPIGRENEARAFYIGLLGLKEISKPESLTDRGGFWLLAGAIALHIGVEPDWDRTQTKAHVAFSVADVETWRARFATAGCQVIESVPIAGRDRFESNDPFGNRLELISRA